MKHLWSPWRMTYIQQNNTEKGCVFCNALASEDDASNLVIYRGDHAFVILNRYPYTSGHLMIVPNEHSSTVQALSTEARSEVMELASRALTVLAEAYHPEGYNLGMNLGEIAGAGIAEHVHLHIVPRWGGDTNFMSTTAMTRVIPEALEETYLRVKKAWDHIERT